MMITLRTLSKAVRALGCENVLGHVRLIREYGEAIQFCGTCGGTTPEEGS